ncbi:hypothetical protein KCP71_22090 [Salmonella enterica subsp. enterica]|nr:hypothetical protein KCP71_22090 [Salmonella enterica subsp. enterica]
MVFVNANVRDLPPAVRRREASGTGAKAANIASRCLPEMKNVCILNGRPSYQWGV